MAQYISSNISNIIIKNIDSIAMKYFKFDLLFESYVITKKR